MKYKKVLKAPPQLLHDSPVRTGDLCPSLAQIVSY